MFITNGVFVFIPFKKKGLKNKFQRVADALYQMGMKIKIHVSVEERSKKQMKEGHSHTLTIKDKGLEDENRTCSIKGQTIDLVIIKPLAYRKIKGVTFSGHPVSSNDFYHIVYDPSLKFLIFPHKNYPVHFSLSVAVLSFPFKEILCPSSSL